MTLLRIALKSARFRKTSLILTIVSIAISVTLLLGVDVVRKEAKSSFAPRKKGRKPGALLLRMFFLASACGPGRKWAVAPGEAGRLGRRLRPP